MKFFPKLETTVEQTYTARKAIWLPIWGKQMPMYFIGAAMLTIAYCALCTSAGPTNWEHAMPRLMMAVTDVRAKALASTIPFPTVLAYGGALLLAPLVAVLICFCKIIKHKITVKKSVLDRTIYVLGGVCLIIVPYFFELKSSIFRPDRSIEALKHSRIALVVWSEGAFLLYTFIFCGVLVEMTHFLKYLAGGKHDNS